MRRVRVSDMADVRAIAESLGVDGDPVFFEVYADRLERWDGNNPDAVANVVLARARALELRRGGVR